MIHTMAFLGGHDSRVSHINIYKKKNWSTSSPPPPSSPLPPPPQYTNRSVRGWSQPGVLSRMDPILKH